MAIDTAPKRPYSSLTALPYLIGHTSLNIIRMPLYTFVAATAKVNIGTTHQWSAKTSLSISKLT
jgi:hypothetical protein